jgi:hypothetical protein
MLTRLLILIFSLSVTLFSQISFAAAPEQIHILVDISGNMQRFDTDLHRIAALKEMINQLPEGSRAGIWTYAKQVNNLVPAGTVNNAWRTRAKDAISKIRGYGPYSNLTKATEDATYIWRTNRPDSARKLVIFTAAGAKPSLNSAENQTSRDNLLNKILPSFAKSKVTVYTIAFTSQADLALLQKLAETTNGGYFQASGSDDLAPAFMRLSEALKNNAIPATITTTASTPAATPTVEKPADTKTAETTTVAKTKTKEISADTKTEAASSKDIATTTNQSVAAIAAAANKPKENTTTEITSANTESKNEIRDAISQAEAELGELLTEFAAMPKDEKAQAPALTAPSTSKNKPEPLVITLNDGSVLVTPGKAKEVPIAESFENTENTEVADVANEFQAPSETATDTAMPASTIPDTFMSANPEQHLASTGWLESKTQGDLWALILTVLVFINLTVIVMLVIGRFVWLRYTQKKQKVDLLNMEEPSTEMES